MAAFERMTNDGYQIIVNGRRLWVNSPQGMCVARFGNGLMEVHKDAEQQMATGEQCLDCRRMTQNFDADWAWFVRSVKQFYGVMLLPMEMPERPKARP
jgi:hypothetical protein